MFWHLRVGVGRRQVSLFVAIALAVNAGISTRGHALQSPPSQSGEAIPPLVEAIWTQDVEKVKQLLADGADPDAKTNTVGSRIRPVWAWAIIARDDRSTELLLSKLKKVDSAEALLVAANRNDVSLARALFERGMPVDARAINGATPLLVAAASGHVATLRLLIERGSNVNLADNHSDTALMAAVPSRIDRVGQAPACGRR